MTDGFAVAVARVGWESVYALAYVVVHRATMVVASEVRFKGVLEEVAHGVAEEMYGPSARRFGPFPQQAARVDQIVAELEEATAECVAGDLGVAPVREIGPIWNDSTVGWSTEQYDVNRC